jgi:circadian clock protein KaiC
MLMRLIDYAKSRQITGMFINLSEDLATNPYALEATQLHVSSLMDTWIILKNIEGNGERNRVFSIIKARGIAHSNQLREFLLTSQGIQLLDLYKGTEGVLFGSARVAQENREAARRVIRNEEIARRQRELDRKKLIMENEIVMLKEKFARDEDEIRILIEQDLSRENVVEQSQEELMGLRKAEN